MGVRLKVTCQNPEGLDVHCGDLYTQAHNGRETVLFRYSDGWLSNGFELSPDMPLMPSPFSSAGGFGSLRAFEDAMPDRWGRNLLDREERHRARDAGKTPRMLLESDYLIGIGDRSRQGALRIWDEEGRVLSASRNAIPREVELPKLLDAADCAAKDLDADVRDLVDAGSSLGGARPKAAVRDVSGALCICKFPKSEEVDGCDVCAWEHVTALLAERAGIEVPQARLLRLGKRNALLLRRFDREGERRIPYISGMSAVEGRDGGSYSLLDLVDFIEDACEDPEGDCRKLWYRGLFGCCVGNTDNHMRNYGFLRGGTGWRLAPQFDVNPTIGGGKKDLSSGMDDGDFSADVNVAIDVAGYYRIAREEVASLCARMMGALSQWKKLARLEGIPESQVCAMTPTFEEALRKLELAAKG